MRVGPELGDDQLPKKTPILLGKAQQHPSIALVTGIPWRLVVRPDKHPPVGDNGCCPGLAAQPRRPLYILPRSRVKTLGQTLFLRYPVTGVPLLPLGPIRGTGQGTYYQHAQQAAQRQPGRFASKKHISLPFEFTDYHL